MPTVKTPRATIDFETRSAVKIRMSGSWRYSVDPSTEPLCLAYRLPHWKAQRVELWHPAFPHLGIEESHDPLRELFDWIQHGEAIEAHNAFFERGIWTNIMVPRFGWPSIQWNQWRCSAAKAAACALPRGLDEAATALRLAIRKDAEGHKLMLKLSKPRKPRKKELETWLKKHGHAKMPRLYYESKEWFERLWAYCRQDVLAEEALSDRLPDLPPLEQEMYLLDQLLNERGFRLDMGAVETALWLLKHESTVLNGELATITEGAVEKATQRDRLLAWFHTQGLELEDTQKTTIDDLLKIEDHVMPTPVRRALEILRALGRSSTAKYQSMKAWVCPDQRVHGGLLYHAASTGRWSGQGIQPQNFPRGTVKAPMELLWEFLMTRDIEAIVGEFGSVSEPLSTALRGAIVASPGKHLFVADYAAIEARVLFWLARDEDALDIFRRGEDIYCEMATEIYDRTITKEHDPQERQLGKATILGCGYQMGASKFVATAATYGVVIDDDFSKVVVDTYRSRFFKVKNFWYDTERCAIEAVEHPRRIVKCGRVKWVFENRFLWCELPSGRRLAYADPKIQTVTPSWGGTKDALTFMGINSYTKQWARQTTYGGSLVENITQAVSRDLMAAAMARVEATGRYAVLLTVHDEVVAEAHPVLGDLKEFESLITVLPDWATGLPIEAEGYTGPRYHK